MIIDEPLGLDKTKSKSHKRDKSLNTTEFNRKAQKRRAKAKFDSKMRKRNQKGKK